MSIKAGRRRFSYRSLFMVVHVRSGPVRLLIPLPLFLIDQTLAAVQELMWVVEHLVPNLQNRISAKIGGKAGSNSEYFLPSNAIHLCRELIDELRSYGKWRMVEIETKRKYGHEAQIYVDFF